MSALSLPLYARRPQRRIPETGGCVAVTMYASKDRSVREYVLFSPEGERIGEAAWHGKSMIVPAGYHEGHGVYSPAAANRRRTWRNLTEAARTLLAEHQA